MGNDINVMCASAYSDLKNDNKLSRIEVQKCIDFFANSQSLTNISIKLHLSMIIVKMLKICFIARFLEVPVW